jgi:hypothetical protein
MQNDKIQIFGMEPYFYGEFLFVFNLSFDGMGVSVGM